MMGGMKVNPVMTPDANPQAEGLVGPEAMPNEGGVEGLMAAVMAYGGSMSEAVGAVATTYGWDGTWPVLKRIAEINPKGFVNQEALKTIAEGVGTVDPDMADRAVTKLLEGRTINFHPQAGWNCDILKGRGWLKAIPKGVSCHGSFYLNLCVGLESIGDGLRVTGGRLDLHGCSSLRSLPRGLHVAGELDLRGCDVWDGVIPEEVVIHKQIRTDRHPNGIFLDAWRKRHPQGEKVIVLHWV
jgi:hypothetical protein